jgi:hypothetical protein
MPPIPTGPIDKPQSETSRVSKVGFRGTTWFLWGGSFQDIRSDYFQAFKEVMGEASVTFSTVVVHPQGGGWKQLRTYMDPESTKLIVISHGVGSNYVAELLAHSNEAHNNIQLWLSLQGAFTGSRLAVTGEREKLSPVALQLVNQDPIGLHPQQRLDFFNKYGGQVDGQLKYIPTITVGTYKKATSHLNSPLASSRELVDSGNIYNDGFVAEGGSQWPGVPHIKLEGYDHLDTVLYSESTKDEQKLMLKTLLMMLWRMK